MSRLVSPPLVYRNQNLMDRLNDLSLRIKLFYMIDDTPVQAEVLKKCRASHKKPTPEEIDEIFTEIYKVLQKDSYNPVKY